MKKFLAICLTLSMLIGCMTFFTLSTSAAGIKTLVLHDCEDLDHGLGVGGAPYLDKQEYVEGSASIATKLTGKLDIAAINFNKGFDKPINVSEYTHLSFDFYVSDVSKIAGTDFWFEMTSTGGPDHGESTYHTNYGAILKENGWNEVKIPLSAFTEITDGGLDKTKFNYFRWFCNSGINAGDGLTLRIDNIRFEDRGGMFTFTVFDASEDKYLLRNSPCRNDSCWFTDGVDGRKPAQIYYYEIPAEEIPYVNELTWTAPLQSQVLLRVSSDGYNYKELINAPQGGYSASSPTTVDLLPYVDFSVSNGIWICLTDADPSNGNGGAIYKTAPTTLYYGLNETAVRGAATYLKSAVNAGAWGTAMKSWNPINGNLSFWNDRMFDPGTLDENYLLRSNAGEHANDHFYFADNQKEVVLKYDISRASDVKGLSFSFMTGAELLVQVSVDDANWETVYSSEGARLDTQVMTLDLTGSVNLEKLKETGALYVRIADSKPEDGWGGKIFGNWPTTLAITRGVPTGGAVSIGEGAIMGMKRIFNSYTLLRNCPFLSRIFGIK